MSNETTNKFSLIDLPDVPDSVDSAVKNLTDETTKNIGQTFGDLWYLIFGGISHAADKRQMKYAADLEQYKKELTNSINEIPKEKKIEPSFQTTAQALENSKYCVSSEHLRKMFIKLITSTMNSDFERYAHPSFPEIIKQMSPMEAMLLSTFKTKPSQPIANFKLSFSNGTTRPIEQYIFFDIDGSHAYKYASAISSLERFGLLSVDFSRWLSAPSAYEIFTKFPYFKHLQSEYEKTAPGSTLEIEKGICCTTPLGIHFIKSCVPDI